MHINHNALFSTFSVNCSSIIKLCGSVFFNPTSFSFWVRFCALTFFSNAPLNPRFLLSTPLCPHLLWVGHPLQFDHSPCFFYLGRSPITVRPFLHLGRSPITTRPLFPFSILGRSPITIQPFSMFFYLGRSPITMRPFLHLDRSPITTRPLFLFPIFG